MPSSARGKNLFMRGDEGIAPCIIQFKRPCKLCFFPNTYICYRTNASVRQTLRAEVIDMKSSEFWRVFAETGDPVVYLLYRSAEDAERSE